MIYSKFTEKNSTKFALLIDPDRENANKLKEKIILAEKSGVDFIFVGSSLLLQNNIDATIKNIKQHSSIPVIIFPGSSFQISRNADAILFLSLISGRNPEFLISNQFYSAPIIKSYNLEAIPTGYILIDGGISTSVEYISNTKPIPANKIDIAVSTAITGEMLGMKAIYMDAGSGAKNKISTQMIEKVKQNINIPIIIGGGIRTETDIEQVKKTGADIIVVGNAIEESPDLISKFAEIIKK